MFQQPVLRRAGGAVHIGPVGALGGGLQRIERPLQPQRHLDHAGAIARHGVEIVFDQVGLGRGVQMNAFRATRRLEWLRFGLGFAKQAFDPARDLDCGAGIVEPR